MGTLGSRLKDARERKHLTQVKVAEKLGISNGTLSGYERNYRDPDTNTLASLARMYDVSTDYLTTGIEKGENGAEETQLEKEQNYVASLFQKISDPDKKKAAIEVLKGLAGEK